MKFKNVAQPIPMAAPIANDGDKNIIPLNSTKTNLASLKDGFPEITQKSPDEGGLPPVRADFNGMFYLSTDQRIYLQNGGVITFSQAVSDEIGGYPKGAVLDFVDDKSHVYMKVRSLIDDNNYDFVKDISFIDGVHWEELKFGAGGSGVELGTVVCMPFGVDESENKYRYLNGQVIIQTQYPAFTAKVKNWQKTRSSLFTTETNWQAEKTASVLGQCGKFVIDDTAGTIRLPLVININGLTDLSKVGVIKNESLPIFEIVSKTSSAVQGGTAPAKTKLTTVSQAYGIATSGTAYAETSPAGMILDGSSLGQGTSFIPDSSTYKDGAPVQQEAIQYPYVICVNTGVEEAERPINDYTVNNPYAYGMSQYCQGVMNNNSWLKSNGQFHNGTVYTGLYAWCVSQLTAGVDGFKASSDTYDDYDFVINTAEQTFRLPVSNGTEEMGNLYYYCGETLQNADLINIARIEEKLTDINATTRGYLVESYVNGLSGYRLYSDGYCEQWGIITSSTASTGQSVSFVKTFKSTPIVLLTQYLTTYSSTLYISTISTSNMVIRASRYSGNQENVDFTWKASGYLAEGQY